MVTTNGAPSPSQRNDASDDNHLYRGAAMLTDHVGGRPMPAPTPRVINGYSSWLMLRAMARMASRIIAFHLQPPVIKQQRRNV